MEIQCIDSALLAKLIRGGIENLSRHVEEVNDLNVFPIPDGDTGSNMLLTIRGGEKIIPGDGEDIGSSSRKMADGMLLSARGNSGVILSQFADGIACGMDGCRTVGADGLARSLKCGVEHAYAAVMEPVEGTILTVVREAAEYAAANCGEDISALVDGFIYQARKTLAETPDMLPVLKKAGVVDSGGAGLIYIAEGMAAVLNGGETAYSDPNPPLPGAKELDLDLFNEDSVLEFGYCTELLLRLQRAKTDPENFDADVIKDFLRTVGDSIVCFKTGSIVKIHVHTAQPYKVLEFCQRFGEYLTVKVENMSLQHNNLHDGSKIAETKKDRVPYGIVAVASGEGIKQTFCDMGADIIVDGGQSMNPSADDFIEAFKKVNADTVIVMPNNSNVILAARQAANMYKESDVRVLESKSIGDGYAALTMLNTDSGDTDAIMRELSEAMSGVVTASVSRCSRSAEMDGFLLKEGQYIGFVGKEIISADNDRFDTACMLADKLDFTGHEICIVVRGKDSDPGEAEDIAEHIRRSRRGCEVFVLNGGQDIHSYILIVE